MSDIYIDVKVYGGTHCHKAIMDMQALADRIGVSVWADLNGVRTLARPGDSWAKIIAAWDFAVANNKEYASDTDYVEVPAAWEAIRNQAREG